MTSHADFILGADPLSKIQKVLSIYADISGNKKLYN